MSPAENASRSAAGDRNPWFVAVIVSIATFMLVLDTSIANVALRNIAGSLAAGVDESTWIITTYLIANAVILPVSGWLMSSAGGVKVIWFSLLELPDLVSRDLALFERLRTWHHWLAWTLMALLALHVAAVLRHDVLRRDGIFRRMSPFTR